MRIGSRLAFALLGTAAFAVPLMMLPDLPLHVVCPAAVVVYGLVLAAAPSIRRSELAAVLALVPGRKRPRCGGVETDGPVR